MTGHISSGHIDFPGPWNAAITGAIDGLIHVVITQTHCPKSKDDKLFNSHTPKTLTIDFWFHFYSGQPSERILKSLRRFSGFLKKHFPTNYIRGVMSDPPHFIIPRSMIITIQGLENKSAGLPLITRYNPGSDLAVTHWGSSKCGWPCTLRKTRAIKRRSCTAPAPIIFICNNDRTD